MIRAVHISQNCSGDASELWAAVIGWKPPGHQVTWWEYKAGVTEGLRSESTGEAESSVPPWGFWFCCLCSPWLRTEGVRMPSCRWLEDQVGNVAEWLQVFQAQTVIELECWEALSEWSLITEHWSLSTDHWSLITDHWALITVHWSLITECRSLITEHWPLSRFQAWSSFSSSTGCSCFNNLFFSGTSVQMLQMDAWQLSDWISSDQILNQNRIQNRC